MKFELGEVLIFDSQSKYQYIRGEYSIDFLGQRDSSAGGLLLGHIAIETSFSGKLMFASGLCPSASWVERELLLPRYENREIFVSGIDLSSRGSYFKVNDDSLWKAYVDKKSKILCIGKPEFSGRAFCFSPGAILVFDEKMVPSALVLNDIGGLD